MSTRMAKVIAMWGTHTRTEILKATGTTPAQLNSTASALRVKGLLPPRWSVEHPCCTVCRRTDRPHEGRGLCAPCHRSWLSKTGRIETIGQPKDSRPEPTVKRGVKVAVPKWRVEGVCLTDPYQWPRNESPVCLAVDIQGVAGRIEGMPLSMVVVA